ncbi:MAG: hypothetical protein JXA23_11450 [Bacteroidales bacterium]|nr:hypothetical protein [Bacteroidales bacterium]
MASAQTDGGQQEDSNVETFMNYLQKNWDDIHDVIMRFHQDDPGLKGIVFIHMDWENGTLYSSSIDSNDTGNPDFLISEEFAQDMGIGIDTGNAGQIPERQMNVRLGGKMVNFEGVRVVVGSGIQWLFNTMHIDGNVPSTVLQKYQVVFDYPMQQLTLAEPGILTPRGVRSPARIHPVTDIIQLDAVIDGENYSFALDNGASFSFISDDLVAKLIQRHPEWPNSKGAVGCANI